MGHQHGAGGQGGQVGAGHPQQDGQQAGADVPHVGGPLAHQLVVHAGKHVGIHGTHGVSRPFGTGAAVNGLLHLSEHEGVGQHGDLAGEDFRLFWAGLLPDVVGHGGGALVELLDGGLQAGLFGLLAGVGDVGVVQALLPHTDGAAQPDASRRVDSFEKHGALLL